MCPAQLRVLPYARSAPRPEQGEKPCTCVGSGAWGRRQGLAGQRATRRAKLAARTASGRAAAPRHQHADKQENTSSVDGEQARRTDGERAARGADGERAARSAGFETTRRAKLAARTASGQLAARTPSGRPSGQAHGTDAERAGRRPQAPTRKTHAYNEAGTRRAKQRRGPRPRETVRPGGPP